MRKYPEGRISDEDDGELIFGITVKDRNLILSFGKPVAWLGMNKLQAIGLAKLLVERANEIKDN